MFNKAILQKISDYLWEIPQSYRKDMKVPARVYISQEMINTTEEEAFQQLVNLATLPGVQKYSLAMPDIHTGYASPIGGVVAIDSKEGIISPGLCGYDINCGMRLLLSSLTLSEIDSYIDKLASALQKEVPSGLGRGRKNKLSLLEIDKILEGGAERIVEQGYGVLEDLKHCEAGGKLEWANAQLVSKHAKERGRDQVGTLGSGNHFLEVQVVEEIYNSKIAQVFGLFKNQIVIMVHTGSRGLGHQVCTDYLKLMISALPKYKISVPDKEFACVPFSSPEGKKYFQAMAAAANFAWANRQSISYYVRNAWKKVLGNSGGRLKLLYDVAHNIIKREVYVIKGEKKEVLVHRKGATRAFPPHHSEIPDDYKEAGQPVLIPGSMGTNSFVLAGTPSGEQSFYSTCHGSGRVMSRHKARKILSTSAILSSLRQKGIIVKCRSHKGITEEAPQAYKDIQQVIEVVHRAGLSIKVARLRPIAVIKGE